MLDRKDIMDAMRGEAFARCRYEIFAEQARSEGLGYFAKVLEETARNELSHFREFMKILNLVGSTSENLSAAIASELEESTSSYPRLQQYAMVDGEMDTARLFQQIAKIEAAHKERLEKLSQLLGADSVYKRGQDIRWKCRVCGYVHTGTEPPKKCPGCQSALDVYEPEDFNI